MTERAEDVKVNGARLSVHLDGPADAPAVALVHALATDHRMWDAQIAAVSERYRVLRYDARGHGRSAAPVGPYSMDMLVDDLLGLLRHFGMHGVHVVGLSLGGLVALATALRNPSEVAGIVVCDARADVPPEFHTGIDDRNRLVREKGMDAVADAFVERWFTPPTLARKPDYLETIRTMIRATSVEGFTACAEAIKHSGLRERIPSIRLPTLFVVGDQDMALPVPLARAMKDDVPGAHLAEIAGAGHLSNIEQPALFNAALLAFLESAGRR